MSADIAGVQLAVSSLANLVLVNPQTPLGILAKVNGAQSFFFHYEGEQSVSLESDITDHFVEDNTAIQDHIALKPERISTYGYIGELSNVTPKDLAPLKAAATKLAELSPFVPAISVTALIAYNTALAIYQTTASAIDAATNTYAAFNNGLTAGGKPVQTKQQLAFTIFYKYQRDRVLFTVQTPWAVFTDMAISSLRAIQDEDSNVVSGFELSFKKMRFASTFTGTVQEFQDRAAAQALSVIDHGPSTPIADVGILAKITALFGSV